MLSSKQKMDLLMESLEAVGSDSKSLNENGEGRYQRKNVEVAFNDKYSNDPHIAFAIEKLKEALWDLELGSDYPRDADKDKKTEFVLKQFKRYGIDIEKMTQVLALNIENGAFNYPPPEKSNAGQGGPFDA